MRADSNEKSISFCLAEVELPPEYSGEAVK